MHTNFSRRTLIAATGVGLTGALGPCAQSAEQEDPPRDADEAFQRLRAGNQRFVNGSTRHAHEAASWRKHLVEGQQPIATILGCSDSRVPPELVFDQGFGDLFVIRVAGNVMEPAVFGSLGYAVVHLKTKLLVVLGHQKCGAITAAVNDVFHGAAESPGIESLLKYVKPAMQDIKADLPAEKQVEAGVEANVRYTMQQLAETPEGRRAIDEKRLTIKGAVYELESGLVRFLASE